MANLNLSEYITTCRLDPHSANDATWYARGTIEHNGKIYPGGSQLPSDGDDAMTNAQIADLLEINGLTSVKPERPEVTTPTITANGEVDENGNPVGQLTAEQEAERQAELQRQQAAGEQGQGGNGQLDENGNPVAGA